VITNNISKLSRNYSGKGTNEYRKLMKFVLSLPYFLSLVVDTVEFFLILMLFWNIFRQLLLKRVFIVAKRVGIR